MKSVAQLGLGLACLLTMSCVAERAAVKAEEGAPAAAANSRVPAGGECRTGQDGVEACGFHCEMGTDGKMQCAKDRDGKCLMGTNGRVACGVDCIIKPDGVAACK